MHRQNFHYNTGQPTNEQTMAAMMENDAAALAAEMFDHFCSATTMRQIFGLFRNMCDTIGVRSGPINEFYPKLKSKIKNWKAQTLWKKFDARLLHRVYNKGTACSGTRVLVIGAGPCGLRTAIEAQLLGAKVVVVEKRDRITRNNVLHLWPFLIHDLRALGAKKFYGKFCAGSIDHISIRQLQCILIKVSLLLGIEIHEGVSFENIIEPSNEGFGWRCATSPSDHAVSHFEFDVLIGADGKRNTLSGFGRKEFRGKLAIAITANFINRRTEEEARIEEISGVAFIFNQSFFKELYHQTGIDLENIVYYKDETHYFVMTAKKHSLLDKGVIIQDFSDPAELLHPNNVNTTKLQDYAREAADFSTKYQMPCFEFAVNHYGKPDVAMFDFTSMFAAENSSRVIVRKNYRLLMGIVGDSLLEPFWPSGSGCARGFLSAMDAAYAIKLYSNSNNSLLSVLSQRESIYRLLAQTTPENLHRDHGSYTLDPMTRYPNLNRQFVLPHQVKHLLDSDDPTLLEQTFMDTNAIQSLPELPLKTRKRRTVDTTPMANVLLAWIKSHLKDQEFIADILEPSQIFTNGKVLCALIHRYRPDLCDWNSIENSSPEESNETAFRIFEKEFKIPPVMSSDESITLQNTEIKTWLHYLEQICEVFRGEIPHVKHPKLDYAEFKQKNQNNNNMSDFSKLHRIAAAKRDAANDENGAKKSRDKLPVSPPPQNVEHRRGRKRRSYEKYGGNIEERMARLADIDANRIDRQNRRRQHRRQQTENFLKSLQMLQVANYLRDQGIDGNPEAFEDYSIYMYRQNAPEFTDRVKDLERKLLYPDRERGIQSAMPRSGNVLDDQFSNRIRNIEEKFTTKNAAASNKKPKDLLRAIGKIESNDWNVKEIEKKIQMSRKITDIGKSREKVPKWSREQFEARQTKMQKPDRQDSAEGKYKEIDDTIKALDKQLKEGSALDRGERGRNKVAAIAASTFGKKKGEENQQSTQKTGLILSAQGVSEACHFCKQRVYLMEKINAEGLVLHRSCLKCHHCHTNLRLGGYAFDRENPDGKFYCTQHFKLPPKDSKFVPKRLQHKQRQAEYAAFKAQQQRQRNTGDETVGDDLDNRGKTPERIEFENADGGIEDEQQDDQIMDENEWTDLNFGTGDEDSVDDESSSDETDSDSDSEIFEDPVGVDAQTLQLASDWIDKRSTMQDSEDEFYGYSSEDDDADSQTEGEELAKAREMRMNEVKLQPPPTYIFTDTETEGVKNSMTQPNENINNQNSDLVSSKAPKSIDPIKTPSHSFGPSTSFNLKDEFLKSDMMKKLSLKEKWLNDNQPKAPQLKQPEPPSIMESNSKPLHMEVDDYVHESKKKDEKKSFFNGIFSSVKQFIKHEKPHEKKKTPSPPPKHISDDFDEILKQNEEESIDLTGNVERKIKKFLQKQKSEEIREGADDILNEIKEEKERLEKHMRDMDQRRFSDNMKAIKSSVAESKVASMKEVNLSKYFPKQQDKKPPAVAKNRDVKALKDVNLSKYFPSQSSPTSGKKSNGSPADLSATSSAAQSPLAPRKNINEIDLANYFPSTPTASRKTSSCTPPSSPLTENPPSLSRKNSVTRYSNVNTIPANPPPPAPKKNILSLQTVKKKPEGSKKENIQEKVYSKLKIEKAKDDKKKSDFNMFDQLLDGASDIDSAKNIDIESFDKLIDEQKLERSPSREYEKIFDSKILNGSKEVSPVESRKVNKSSKKSPKPKSENMDIVKESISIECEKEISTKGKSLKRKSPIKNDDLLDFDPKIIQLLNTEYQRLLGDYERSSKSPEYNEQITAQDNKQANQEESQMQSEKIFNQELLPELQPRTVESKRKSPQRYEDYKKFKENEIEGEIKLIEEKQQISSEERKVSNENDKKMSCDDADSNPAIVANGYEEESLISRLERKYRRSSIKSTDNGQCIEPLNGDETNGKVIDSEKVITEVQQTEEKPYSIIERLEQKLRQKKALTESYLIESAYRPVDYHPKLYSADIESKIQNDLNETDLKNQSTDQVDDNSGPLIKENLSDKKMDDSLVIERRFSKEEIPRRNLQNEYNENDFTPKNSESFNKISKVLTNKYDEDINDTSKISQFDIQNEMGCYEKHPYIERDFYKEQPIREQIFEKKHQITSEMAQDILTNAQQFYKSDENNSQKEEKVFKADCQNLLMDELSEYRPMENRKILDYSLDIKDKHEPISYKPPRPKKESNPITNQAEIKCYENLFSLPKENINDIFSELQMTEMETEKALKEIQDNFEVLNTNGEEPKAIKSERKKNSKKNNKIEKNHIDPVEQELNIKLKIDSLEAQTSVKEPIHNNKITESDALQLESIILSKIDKTLPNRIIDDRRKSLQDDLIEIESGISERPININDLFGRRKSKEDEINGNVNDIKNYASMNLLENKVIECIEETSRADNLNLNRRVSRENVNVMSQPILSDLPKESELRMSINPLTEKDIKAKTIKHPSQDNHMHTSDYLNVLKEISNELIGYDEEQVNFTTNEWMPETAQVNVNKEPSLPKDKYNQNYTNVLQDISNSLIGSDFNNKNEFSTEKNYSQIIPPNVQDIKSMTDSTDILEIPITKPRKYFDDNSTDTEILLPVPPPRRHRLMENRDTPESLYNPHRKMLSPTKSIDDTISGISSTEYFDHYYSIAHNKDLNQLDKYDLTTPSVTKDKKPKAPINDDAAIKYSNFNRHSSESPVRKISTALKVYSDDDKYESKVLFERSKTLHERKEAFMKGHAGDSSNPYIREMMRQDVDNPININDIKFIRKHPSVPLPVTSHKLNSEKYQPKMLSSPISAPSRVHLTYGRTQVAPSSLYSSARSSLSGTNIKTSLSSYNPTSTSHILTKSHALTPANSYGSSSYSSRNRATTSAYSDPISTSTHSRSTSRPFSYTTTSNENNNTTKSSRLSTRDVCSIF